MIEPEIPNLEQSLKQKLKLSIVDHFIAFLLFPLWVLQCIFKQLCKLIPERKVVLDGRGINAVTEITNMLASKNTTVEKEKQIILILARTPNYEDVIEAIKNYAIRKGFFILYLRWCVRSKKLKSRWE